MSAADLSALRRRFRDIVTSEEQLRTVVGQPPEHSVAKVINSFDDHVRSFVAHSPFVFVASTAPDGAVDVSPKGDAPGFVKLLDDQTLAIPDRPGNRRLDTFRNILKNPDVGLIFVIPGITHTLRMSGKAVIVRDLELRNQFAVNGKTPEHVLVVDVFHILSHCPKCMVRSALWQPDKWPETSSLPSFAEMIVAHSKVGRTVEEMQTMVEQGNRERLY